MSGISIGPGAPGGPQFDPTAPVAQPHEADVAAATGATLRFGSRGEDVRGLQSGLARLGFLSGPADGVFGRGTERALATFQRQKGLTPDGIAGPRTLAALDAALASAPGPKTMVDAAKAL